MNFRDKKACLNTWILVHDLLDLLDIGMKNANASDITAIKDWRDKGSHIIYVKRKMPSSVFPENIFDAILMGLWPSPQKNGALLFGCAHHLPHTFIGNGCH
jgi:hypothetical protein